MKLGRLSQKSLAFLRDYVDFTSESSYILDSLGPMLFLRPFSFEHIELVIGLFQKLHQELG